MKPDDQDQTPQIVPAHNPAIQPSTGTAPQTEATDNRVQAADVLRHQIDGIYNGGAAVSTGELEVSNPYERTHDANPQIEVDEWKAYHSAWQNYYRQYYEAYYAQQAKASTGNHQAYFSSQPPRAERLTDNIEDETISKDEALYTLRQKLLQTVVNRAQKVKSSRHFGPIISALAVVILFVFIQYNQFFVAQVMAYVSPGQIDPNNIVVDPSVQVVVGPDPKLIIPKINVDVPVSYDIGNDYNSQMAAMAKGVAHFAIPGASSHPGENGNTVIAGHSSNDLFDGGDYKFIFSQLDRLEVGDSIYADYKGTRYTYIVYKKEVVQPTDVSALVLPNDKPVMTLLTCTPLGTAINRLLVFASQVSPDPKSATNSTSSAKTPQPATIPGTQPTLLERLFGANG